jgi:hypothetical protein
MDKEKFNEIRNMFEKTEIGTYHSDIQFTECEKEIIRIYMNKLHKPWFFCCDNCGIQSKHPRYEEN